MTNFKILKITLSTIGVIMLTSLSNAVSAKSVNDIMKEYYPIYNEAQQCQGIIANDGTSNGEGELGQIGYCVKVDRQLQLQTKQGLRLYLAITGEIGFHEDGSEAYSAHVFTGLVGMLVLKPQGSGWEVEYANPAMNAGASGEGLKDWKLIQIAPDLWGFINIHSDSHYIQSFSEYVLLAPDPKSKRVIDSHITAKVTMENNPFALSGCSKDKNIDYCAWIKAKLGIDKTTVVNGFYPLEITVNGYEYNHDGTEKKTYNNQVYKINYEPKKGYQVPKDYPLQ